MDEVDYIIHPTPDKAIAVKDTISPITTKDPTIAFTPDLEIQRLRNHIAAMEDNYRKSRSNYREYVQRTILNDVLTELYTLEDIARRVDSTDPATAHQLRRITHNMRSILYKERL